MELKKITLRPAPGEEPQTLKFPADATVETILQTSGVKTKYPIYAARINNKVRPLMAVPEDGDEVVFLDMRDSCAKEIYQRSVIDLFQERYGHRPAVFGGVLEEDCAALLRDFFREKR